MDDMNKLPEFKDNKPPVPDKDLKKKLSEIAKQLEKRDKEMNKVKQDLINEIEKLRKVVNVKKTREELEKMSPEQVYEYSVQGYESVKQKTKYTEEGVNSIKSLIEKQKSVYED